MSVLLKRGGGVARFPHECPYGCCTPVYGKNVKNVRRAIKRGERSRFRADLRAGNY